MSKEKNLPPLDPIASAEPVAAQRTTLGKSLDKTDAVYGITALRVAAAPRNQVKRARRDSGTTSKLVPMSLEFQWF